VVCFETDGRCLLAAYGGGGALLETLDPLTRPTRPVREAHIAELRVIEDPAIATSTL
jgi:hypothetical protein